ncbi:MAG: hypothetical protein GEV11_04675 [Streptosporangiales bacterium]|nr:hypothetical protein [Streptosporangiales bacterium]
MTERPTSPESMLIDEVLPEYDATIVEFRLVEAAPEVAYASVAGFDPKSVHSAALDGLFALRDLAWRFARAAKNAETGDPDVWTKLGERPGRELVVGTAGRFWTPRVEWRSVTAEAFGRLNEPGIGRIAVGFAVRPYGTARTLISYEARTSLPDERSRSAFLAYWLLVRGPAAVVMRTQLRTIARNVRTRARHGD